MAQYACLQLTIYKQQSGCPRVLSLVHAAVDGKIGPCHERAIVRAQVRNQRRHVHNTAEPPFVHVLQEWLREIEHAVALRLIQVKGGGQACAPIDVGRAGRA